MRVSSDDFWLFANRIYARPEVADACLWLQHRHDLDVMLLLLCLWAGHQRGALHPTQLRMLIAAGEPWHQGVVKPLRSARQWLKGYQSAADPAPDRAALRQAIADSELAAERLQGAHFAALLRNWTGETLTAKPGAAAAESNVRLYLALLSLTPDEEDEQRLRAILTAFPEPA